jgi:hypothetical protein
MGKKGSELGVIYLMPKTDFYSQIRAFFRVSIVDKGRYKK